MSVHRPGFMLEVAPRQIDEEPDVLTLPELGMVFWLCGQDRLQFDTAQRSDFSRRASPLQLQQLPPRVEILYLRVFRKRHILKPVRGFEETRRAFAAEDVLQVVRLAFIPNLAHPSAAHGGDAALFANHFGVAIRPVQREDVLSVLARCAVEIESHLATIGDKRKRGYAQHVPAVVGTQLPHHPV